LGRIVINKLCVFAAFFPKLIYKMLDFRIFFFDFEWREAQGKAEEN
jgi:hypothetical protein